MLAQRELKQDLNGALIQKALFGRHNAGPGPAATSVDLTALHREFNIVAAGIARDEAELRAEHAFDDFREHVRIGAGAGAADNEFLGIQILKLVDAGAGIGGADADFVGRRADPGKFRRVEARGFAVTNQRFEGHTTADDAHREAILGGSVVKPVGKLEAARAFHIDGDDGRVARDVFADMARHDAAIGVVTTTYREADVHFDDLAVVEIGDRVVLGACRARYESRRQRGQRENRQGPTDRSNVHNCTPGSGPCPKMNYTAVWTLTHP